MRIVGLMLARNEDWVIRLSLRAALAWCDDVVVLLHACTDQTEKMVRAIERTEAERIHVLIEPNPLWREMDFRQRMLEQARTLGATHIALVDADEVLTGNLILGIREFASELDPGEALSLPMICPWRGLWQHRTDPESPWGRTQIDVLVAVTPALTWKPDAAGYQHHHRLPYGVLPVTHRPQGGKAGGGMFHLQWVNWERLIWKQRLYVLNEVLHYRGSENPRAVNDRYRASVSECGIETERVPEVWWGPYDTGLIDLKQRGWHRAQCEQIVATLKPGALKGLDLFGWEPWPRVV